MSGEDYSESYAQVLEETITLRRFSNSTPTRTPTNYTARGRATAIGAADTAGSVKQSIHTVIVLSADLVSAGMTLPVKTSDAVEAGGQQLAIEKVLARKAPDGTLIAYELTCVG